MENHSDDGRLNRAFADSLGYLLTQSGRLFRENLAEALVPLGLSLSEYGSLRLISLNTPMSQGVLGSRYGIDRTTMVAVMDKLEERGMVRRERSVSDRRSYRLSLTPKGRKVLSRALRIATNEQQKFLTPLSTSEWSILKDCLGRLIETHMKPLELVEVKESMKTTRRTKKGESA
jgi:DNA-binding MarR family transcriptional regulator